VPWSPGDLLTHRFNPELGVGRVTAVEGRAIVVEFPRAKTTLRIAATSDALTRVEPGSGIRDPGSGITDPKSRGVQSTSSRRTMSSSVT
jgi:hypothetical protein